MGFQIAIDGPSGSGKSSVARKVAKDNNFIYIDTGAMYRVVGLNVIDKGVSLDNTQDVIEVTKKINMKIKPKNGIQNIYLDDEDVTNKIRTEQVGEYASKVSTIPEIRKFLVELQQSLASNNDVVMDGRDICSVVLPSADVKIFLDASAKARANRRANELKQKGIKVDLDQILKDITERDERDMTREATPLSVADDATYIDSSDLTFDEVVQTVQKMIGK